MVVGGGGGLEGGWIVKEFRFERSSKERAEMQKGERREAYSGKDKAPPHPHPR